MHSSLTLENDPLLVPPPTDAGLVRRSGFGLSADAPNWPDFLIGQPARPVRVVVIDDDPGIRRVIAQALSADPRTVLEGQAASLAEGRRLLLRTEFDVALIDLRLGDGSGFELVETVRCHRSGGECVVISVLEDEQDVLRALELGATGYLLKNCWFQDYALAVLKVANGGAAITPSLARRLLARLDAPRSPRPRAPAGERGSVLSTREREVLRCVAAGYVSSEIAAKLAISAQTVNSHIKSVYRKLHAHTRGQAVSAATRSGLL